MRIGTDAHRCKASIFDIGVNSGPGQDGNTCEEKIVSGETRVEVLMTHH